MSDSFNHSGCQQIMKRAMDLFIAAVALILLSPVFLCLILMITRDGGPAFYAQRRIGKNGKTFQCWKFRSMVLNADQVLADLLAKDPKTKAEWEKDFKLKDDPRITKIGHFLRKTSLDEIPQFYNVLRGEMSIVGPRPIVDAERAYYGDKFHYYLSVAPGITGLWQISGRNDVSYDQRVSMDCSYVQNWSNLKDMDIIIKTFGVVLKGKGAY